MKVLMFGGNGCIGSSVAELLLANHFELTLLNRGHWRWNTAQSVKPFVKWIYCDRERPDTFDWTELEAGGPYNAVIDFSAYSTECIRPFYRRLKVLSHHFIFISSDSIYEMCEVTPGTTKLREEVGVRPESLEVRLELAKMDSYADGKLLAEEFLMEERKLDGMSYTILRLPDVLAERDSTKRWWQYQIWMQFNDLICKDITIPLALKELSTSYVYVADIARFILAILMDPSRSIDQVFNFASFSLTVRQLLDSMRHCLHLDSITMIEGKNEDPCFFPSVGHGPIDCSRVMGRYCIPLTIVSDCTQNLCNFYNEAIKSFPEERDEVVASLCEELELSPETTNNLKEAIRSFCSQD
ncbi:NAD binding 10 domain containing protein [Trichuris trichiura]|uniref:NAD binding 10 domain containing protein n=1 Tax=Trichuris trichiura TaxID=36087 RepID=A0A077ZDG1_TRITR|nr:NAD binding 10 domain containing protein [Trichuris trichiura]